MWKLILHNSLLFATYGQKTHLVATNQLFCNIYINELIALINFQSVYSSRCMLITSALTFKIRSGGGSKYTCLIYYPHFIKNINDMVGMYISCTSNLNSIFLLSLANEATRNIFDDFQISDLSIPVLELKASSEFQNVIEIVKNNVAGFLKGININILMDIFYYISTGMQ